MPGRAAGSDSVIPSRHNLLWIGADGAADLELAKAAASTLAVVHAVSSPVAAMASPPEPFLDRSPAVILLGSSSPGRWTLGDAVALSTRWPLSPIVSVASTLVDGRRRSGPPLPGVEEVMWHDLPGRLAAWLDDRRAGRPGTLGLPATARREEGIVESVRPRLHGVRMALAGARSSDLDWLADLAVTAGASVARRHRGRPPLDDDAGLLAWDAGVVDGTVLAWLGMLVAHQPRRRVILLESFPRPETTALARAAGASAVLGRPCGVETFAGTLLAIQSAG